MKKAVFVVFTVLLWTLCLGLLVLVWLEHLGGYDMVKKAADDNSDRFELFKTGYYGQPLERDPYDNFSVQNPHPFYLFGLPYTKEGIARSRTPIIALNQLGFRASFQNGAAAKGIFLGGSTAFGSQASGDGATIPSVMNKLQKTYDFFNFGVPSWNSHQEMVAYLKAPFKPDFVLAFSGANDFSVAYHYCVMGYDFPVGAPESFEHLAAMTDDIRGSYRSRGMLEGLFPQTSDKLAKLFGKKKKTGGDSGIDCRPRIAAAAEAFIANQSVVRDLVQARGGKYLLAMQPHLDLIATPRARHAEEAERRRQFFRHVLDSEFCRTTRCVDLTVVFKDAKPLHIRDSQKDPNQAIFSDRVHLTDKGYAAVAEILAREVAK